MSDTEILDWIEEHVDDVAVIRDIGRGVRWEVIACADATGCQIEAHQPTLRMAIKILMRRDQRTKSSGGSK